MTCRLAVAACVVAALFSFAPTVFPFETNTARAGDAAGDERHAFEAAKELGTPEAWNAFLKSYPSGFYSDLARAYLQPKVAAPEEPSASETAAEDIPATAPSSARASEHPCSERANLRSEQSKEPTKITFVNESGNYRAILWIDSDGAIKNYGGLNPLEQVTIETFRTHPWMIATGPGDCLQIFLPAAEPSTVELLRQKADDPKPAPPQPEKTVAPPPAKKKTARLRQELQARQGVLPPGPELRRQRLSHVQRQLLLQEGLPAAERQMRLAPGFEGLRSGALEEIGLHGSAAHVRPGQPSGVRPVRRKMPGELTGNSSPRGHGLRACPVSAYSAAA